MTPAQQAHHDNVKRVFVKIHRALFEKELNRSMLVDLYNHLETLFDEYTAEGEMK